MTGRGRPKAQLLLSEDERATLERWARRRTTAQALAQRCRIVLACAEGLTNQEVAAAEGVHQVTRSASGGPGLWPSVSTACTTSLVRVRRARSAMPTWSG